MDMLGDPIPLKGILSKNNCCLFSLRFLRRAILYLQLWRSVQGVPERSAHYPQEQSRRQPHLDEVLAPHQLLGTA